jgi:hypothetical protein
MKHVKTLRDECSVNFFGCNVPVSEAAAIGNVTVTNGEPLRWKLGGKLSTDRKNRSGDPAADLQTWLSELEIRPMGWCFGVAIGRPLENSNQNHGLAHSFLMKSTDPTNSC